MAQSELIDKVDAACEAEGLTLFGGFHPNDKDNVPDLPTGDRCATLLIVGNVGSNIWPGFSASAEFHRDTDPLNHWTERVIDAIADRFGAGAVYPFGGPPYHPFQRWAQRAAPVFSSPIGMLIHPTYGLWMAFRGALLFPERLPIADRTASVSPCETCADKPCLQTCPVGAFTDDGYDVPACARYLQGPEGGRCLDHSCQARRACPIGTDFTYSKDHAQFHMRAFFRAHSGKSDAV